jgi:hypothetical protein
VADLIAILSLGLQYSLIISIIDLYLRTELPLVLVMIGFLALAAIGIAIWHKKKASQSAAAWGKLLVIALILGIGFFGVDLLVALLNGQRNPLHVAGGLLGLPLTVLVFPAFTMICLAGLVRAVYISRRPGAAE